MNTIIVNTYIFILNREVQITSPWRLNDLMKPKSSYNIWFFTFHLNDSFSKICPNNSATLMQIILIQIQNFIYSKFTQILEKFRMPREGGGRMWQGTGCTWCSAPRSQTLRRSTTTFIHIHFHLRRRLSNSAQSPRRRHPRSPLPGWTAATFWHHGDVLARQRSAKRGTWLPRANMEADTDLT